MTKPIRIPKDRLKQLWFEGYAIEALAEYFCCSRETIAKRKIEYGIGRRPPRPGGFIQTPPKAEKPKVDTATLPDDLNAALLASKGKWVALTEITSQHGLTMVQAQQRYHRLRANVR